MSLRWLLIIFFILFDMQNVIAWWRGRVLKTTAACDEDYTILVPVYGHPRYFQERAHLAHLKDKIVVIVECSAPGMPELADELAGEGWRVHRLSVAPACSPELMYRALQDGVITTGYAIRMDADTRPGGDLGRAVAAMRRDGADLCSVKCHVYKPRTVAQRFQALEYRMAMLSRHFRPLLTSGACYIGRTDSLLDILSRHTFWWAGEDVEAGRIAYARRMRVRHVDMTVYTEAPDTWRALFRQRRLWWAANFRHAIVNLDKNALHMPTWTFYYLFLVWGGVYFKWHGLAVYTSWRMALLTSLFVWLSYVLITFVGNIQAASPWMLIFPPYALVQSMLMPLVGSVYYVLMVRRIGNWGRYRFGYRRRPSFPERAHHHREELREALRSLGRPPALSPLAKASSSYTVTMPLDGWRAYDARATLAPHRPRLLFLADGSSPVEAAAAARLRQAGFRVFVGTGSPMARLAQAIAAGRINTQLVLPLKAGETPGVRLGHAVAAALADGGDLYRLRRLALEPRSLPARLEAQLVKMSSLSARHGELDGSRFLWGRGLLVHALASHTSSGVGEWHELERIAVNLEVEERPLAHVVLAAGPDRFRDLLAARRRAWTAAVQHELVNGDHNLLSLPGWLVAVLAALALLLVYRHVGYVDERNLVACAAALLGGYVALKLVGNWGARSRWLLPAVLWQLLAAALTLPFGVLGYLALAGRRRSLGRYRFGYERRDYRTFELA